MNFFRSIFGAIKVAIFLFLLLPLILSVLLMRVIAPGNVFLFPRLFYGVLTRLMGIRVRVTGTPCEDPLVLYTSNHVSYLDIPVLGSTLKSGFIAKSEVASWPLFGFMSKVLNTVFIERKSTRAVAQRSVLQERIASLKHLILFPEGTSTRGIAALPFKSSLFSIFEQSASGNVTIQPVSLVCTQFKNKPITDDATRDLYAWHGDMTLLPHLWAAFKTGDFTVDLTFHTPIAASGGMDRKQLATTCHDMVARGIEASLRGQPAVQSPALLTINA
jgi:1-acyl-sn-glycerol-3-phosphate acyltransferase